MKKKKKKVAVVKFSPKKRLVSHPPNREVVDAIKKEIIKYVKSKYGFFERTKFNEWYVGITHDDDQRIKGHKSKKQLKELKDFKSWQTKSFSNARTVETELCSEFVLNSCQVIGGVNVNSKRVYVYNIVQSENK